MAAPQDSTPLGYADAPGARPFEVEFDITLVGGDESDRLAVRQAEVILDVLTWLGRYAADGGEPSD